MKKLGGLFVVLLLIIGVTYFVNANSKTTEENNIPSPSKYPSPTVSNSVSMNSIFVPYWSFNESITSNNERLLYFGIAANEKGIDHNDDGYKKLTAFSKSAQSQDTYLTVRMVNNDVNLVVLRDVSVQEKIIQEAIAIAKDYRFKGIVLDLESSSLSFDAVINRITNFFVKFNKKVKESDLMFAIALYGDTFYRSRPYDVETLGKNADEVIIMAYDFHKSRGNPGPNFPLNGKSLYGYDFKQMIEDYKKAVPLEKLSVSVGMFGYDWPVDSEGRSISSAEPLATNEAEQKFVNSCSFSECNVLINESTKEVNVTYIDEEGRKHSVWFETLDSVNEKRKYLEEQGINSLVYWAYSYY